MPVRPRRTKIIATIGPSCQSTESLLPLIKAGVDLVRINFSHGQSQKQLINISREAAKLANKEIGIIADLQGPKIRIATFKKNWITLSQDATFTLDCVTEMPGDENFVGLDYKALWQDVSVGDTLLLDDGLIELLVSKIEDKKIFCKVINGGRLSAHKGINKLGGGLCAKTLTNKDIEDLQIAVKAGVDYIAVSFTKDANDITTAREKIIAANGKAAVIAKIERAEALTQIDDIIKEADAVMVARGDLGVEIDLAEVPFEQKRIIERARALDKAVITATQMMESMITSPQATRAEVSDVANAVLDGTDAVMFSAETAVGQYPLKVIQTAVKVCISAEKHPSSHQSGHRMDCQFKLKDEAIAMAVMYSANHYPIRAIISLTESGATPLWMSRIRSSIPIYALTPHLNTIRKSTLYRGVYPVAFQYTEADIAELRHNAINLLKSKSLIEQGDKVILTHGSQFGIAGGTDSMKILTVP